jgi:hypothetical protein
MDEIRDRSAGSGRIALRGKRGIGKPGLAVTYAPHLTDDYPGGTFWLEADPGLIQAIREPDQRMKVSSQDPGLSEGQTEEEII